MSDKLYHKDRLVWFGLGAHGNAPWFDRWMAKKEEEEGGEEFDDEEERDELSSTPC